MSKTVTIVREHHLSYEKALAIANQWQAEGEADFGLVELSKTESEGESIVTFERKGLTGMMRVNESQFELELTLGFLFWAYKDRIVKTINDNIDAKLS